ncbi:unnamed protein product [Protopolystoma xenopodis]|uniref:Uncharacterized protein n=1 Tax=Protopolystoma xenopodis TaxID=117903 RepID=A0A448X3F2_9PLAT|nr:unnamed protein product [Protopolystoma xenopodis]
MAPIVSASGAEAKARKNAFLNWHPRRISCTRSIVLTFQSRFTLDERAIGLWGRAGLLVTDRFYTSATAAGTTNGQTVPSVRFHLTQ